MPKLYFVFRKTASDLYYYIGKFSSSEVIDNYLGEEYFIVYGREAFVCE